VRAARDEPGEHRALARTAGPAAIAGLAADTTEAAAGMTPAPDGYVRIHG
jgi:hypothetical protein